MRGKFQSIRGMHDILPSDVPTWRAISEACRALLTGYGYEEIRLPIVETSDLFTHAIGDATDVVSKEMYAFDDRDGTRLALRPEGTAGCARAVIQNGLIAQPGQALKLWYEGPMFRHERPQRGRYRCFHQIGAEAYGLNGPDVDAELVVLCARLWRMMGIRDVRLEINTLATREVREVYRKRLREYFSDHVDALDDDSKVRLERNVMRILDSKNPDLKGLIEGAPTLLEHLDDESATHFAQFKALLDAAGVDYVVNPRLVRGLDYYSRTVFEFITTELGAQGTICGGGRYDYLLEQQGGKPTPAVGFSMGLERIVDMMKTAGLEKSPERPQLYLVTAGAEAETVGFALAERLRDELPWLRLQINLGGGSFKAQFKRADRSGAAYAMVIGDAEAAAQTVNLKPLRADQAQSTVTMDGLNRVLTELRAENAL